MRSVLTALRKNVTSLAALAVLIAAFALILRGMGRIWTCTCGIGLWTSDTVGTKTSQLFADPYSSSHLLHGIIFFGFLHLFREKLSLRLRFFLAVLIEMGWEILENSPIIINRYRSVTAAYDYLGDSILNSVGDVLFCALGFWLAWKLPWKVSLVIIFLVELVMLFTVRDNLTLNVLMLITPIPAIKAWQMGA